MLLRSWIGQTGAAGLSERVARVPAGRDERDPQRFWLSVLAALRQTAPRIAAGAGGDGGAGPWTAGRSPSGCWRIWRRWMTGCGRWSMMHELGPLALRQLELLITRAPPGLRFVLATRHDVRRRADVQAEQDRRVAGIRLAEAEDITASTAAAANCGDLTPPRGRMMIA